MPAVDFSDVTAQLAAVTADAKAMLDKVANAAAADAHIAKLSSDLATANEDLAASQAQANDLAAQLKALHEQIVTPAPAPAA